MMFRVVLPVLLYVLAVGCHGGGTGRSEATPTGPTSQFPVTGALASYSPTPTGVIYNGTATKAVPQLQQSMTCPTSTMVSQNGNTLTVAPLILAGECHNLLMPVGEMTLDSTGAITSSNSGSFIVSCGTYTYTATGALVGDRLRLSIDAISEACPAFSMIAELSR